MSTADEQKKWYPYPVEEEKKRLENKIAAETPHAMWFCHMDVKYGNEDWTEAETVKTFRKEEALHNFKEVQELRKKNVLVKNLKLCKLGVVVEREEEGGSNE